MAVVRAREEKEREKEKLAKVTKQVQVGSTGKRKHRVCSFTLQWLSILTPFAITAVP